MNKCKKYRDKLLIDGIAEQVQKVQGQCNPVQLYNWW